jgi:uncharacterized RDD family membrane protein YckC
MAKRHYADRESIKASLGSSGMSAHICWFLGAIFAILGIIADAADITLGLTSMGWFLLAIVTFLASITYFFGMGLAWYLITTDRKKEE